MAKEEYTTLSGTVVDIVFQNAENGYTVLRMECGGDIVTAVGCMPGAAAGVKISMKGSWTSHPSYGEQFKADQAECTLPDNAESIYEYLASGAVKGIKARSAELIVRKFGADSLRVIEEEPERLAEIKGITAKKAADICAQFRKQAGVRKLLDFLGPYGLNAVGASRLHRIYGDGARQAVMDNPYLLADEYFGMNFRQADELAMRLGYDAESAERIGAAVIFEIEYNEGNGHTFLPTGKLADATSRLIGVDGDKVLEAISDLNSLGYIRVVRIAGEEACYPEDLYKAETYVAERLLEMASWPRGTVKDLSRRVESAEERCGVRFAEIQRQAIETAAESGVMILTGGPGTGKTTTVRGILELFDDMGLRTFLTAPTGRAAKRMTELTGREAQTVHRLLEAGAPDENGRERGFTKCASDQLKCDAVVLDESSMMDISLMSALLEAMPSSARLIMVGDADQLPSVGPGNVFSDCIKSGAVPVVRLSEIFRQAQESRIVSNAHLINSGIMPELKNTGGDFFFLQRQDADRITDTIVGLVASRLPDNMGIPSEEIQVLSPSRKQGAGTAELNTRLQEALNPPAVWKKERNVSGKIFRVGDRVIQTRNNYDILWYKDMDIDFDEADAGDIPDSAGSGVYNGDIGYIEDIDERQEYARIRFDDRVSPYPLEMMGDLELAYAMTVHKSQGSEYRAVILAVPKGMPMLKTRGVLYTGVTRAKELLIIAGAADEVSAMVENDRRQRRYSGLRARLAGEKEEKMDW